MENTNFKTIEINESNLELAITSIKNFSTLRKLILQGELNLQTPSFITLGKKKAYRNALYRVINKPTMKNINVFLHLHSKFTETKAAKLEYSETEKAIKSARSQWKKLREDAEKARLAYKEIKGDFYK